jgi:hypothetical protein
MRPPAFRFVAALDRVRGGDDGSARSGDGDVNDDGRANFVAKTDNVTLRV